jgi:hypothetical protein
MEKKIVRVVVMVMEIGNHLVLISRVLPHKLLLI